MKPTQKEAKRRFDKIYEMYINMSLRDIETFMWLASEHIEIPHAFDDGVVRGMEVEDLCINGPKIQLNTNYFSNHCENLEKNERD